MLYVYKLCHAEYTSSNLRVYTLECEIQIGYLTEYDSYLELGNYIFREGHEALNNLFRYHGNNYIKI